MNLVLIGYRGTGKSTVARLIGQRLGWPWFDSDDEVERRAGMSIAQLFATQGEGVFRDCEGRVVADLAGADRAVLALGGGAVLRSETRDLLARRSRVVWLQASAQTLWERIRADQQSGSRRPPLTAAGGITEIIATLAAREDIYRRCAQFQVDTEGKSPDQVADAIVEWFAPMGESPP